MLLRIHSRIDSSMVNGPGRRAVIWVQGCSLACAGCWNPNTHSTMGGTDFEITEILEWIRGLWRAGAISGLTVTGGEPLEQVAALATLLAVLRRHLPDFSIGLFSGYTERELMSGRFRYDELSTAERLEAWKIIRACLDFAVLGRFNQRLPANAPLVTSRNQRLCLLSDRHGIAEFGPQCIEFTIGCDGFTQITGFAGRAMV